MITVGRHGQEHAEAGSQVVTGAHGAQLVHEPGLLLLLVVVRKLLPSCGLWVLCGSHWKPGLRADFPAGPRLVDLAEAVGRSLGPLDAGVGVESGSVYRVAVGGQFVDCRKASLVHFRCVVMQLTTLCALVQSIISRGRPELVVLF